MKRHNKSQSGQVLLVSILFATVLLTIGLTIANITSQDTRVTRLEEEESRARAAAEAGIEAALGQAGDDSVDIGSLLNGENLTGTAVFTPETGPTFTTPLITKDGQYTFYLIGYDTVSQTIQTGSYDDDIIINRITPSASDYCTGAQAFAVELTLIDATPSTGGIVQRYVIDDAACDIVAGTQDQYEFGDTIPVSAVTPDPSIIIARIIAPNSGFDGAQIQFQNASNNDFPAQGRTVVSTASSGDTANENVTKKIRLFQSYPQLPAEFFVTSM